MSSENSTANPYLARLDAHTQATVERGPRDALVRESPDPPSAHRGPSARRRVEQLAFWQSDIVRAAINRRITGDANLAPERYFAAAHARSVPGAHALSLRAGDARLEAALLEAGACRRVSGLDSDERRVEIANRSVPEALRGRIEFASGALAEWQPEKPLGAVLARSVLHRRSDLEDVLDRVRSILLPGGLLFVDDFVGPARFQWTQAQLDAINRLLACLPDELLVDLTAADGRRKRSVQRPVPEDFTISNPLDAVRSDEILGALDERFERVEVQLYGGAVYHQLFTRIMGNFAERPELVRMVMEVDAMLTDAGALASDYVWGVWRRPS